MKSMFTCCLLVAILAVTGCNNTPSETGQTISDNNSTPGTTTPPPVEEETLPAPTVIAKGLDNPDDLEIGPGEGQLCYDIEGYDLDGEKFKLSDYRGKVVMLDFYGDW